MVCLSVYVYVVVVDLIDDRGELVNISDHAMENGIQLFTNRGSYILIEVKSTYVPMYVCSRTFSIFMFTSISLVLVYMYVCTY